MTQRVRLTWNRNHDPETDHYRVYRSESPNIQNKNRHEFLIMRVAHPTSVNPVKVENEIPKRVTNQTFTLAHKNILVEHNGESFPFLVEINGVTVWDFSLYQDEGKIVFDNPISEQAHVVVKEYTFDGVQVWDYGIEENGKTYYGPEAKDNSKPDAPKNVMLEADYEKNRIIIRWESSETNGKRYYYRIDAAVTNHKYSGLSEYRWAALKEPLADRPYIIERSLDGVEWRQIAKVKTNVFYEYMIDRVAPPPVSGLVAHIYMYKNRGEAQITLNWDRLVDVVGMATGAYRIRSMNKIGAVSDPSDVVGPIPFQMGLKEVVIRRKLNDGVIPTIDSTDALTVGVVDADHTQFSEDVKDNEEYLYTVFVVDRAGNVSQAATLVVYVGDNTAPPAPTNLSATELQLVVG